MLFAFVLTSLYLIIFQQYYNQAYRFTNVFKEVNSYTIENYQILKSHLTYRKDIKMSLKEVKHI